ncbi:cytidine deaminase [Henriciella sp.]|uniref:cytidine deaminase n=1 Tax=Henriciella sp. TaxID=1968823 RepID=UPI00344B0AFC
MKGAVSPQQGRLSLSQDLFEAARAVRENAHAPYSGFRVGAAVRSKSGIHVGCNVENASFPEGICAEGGAITSMVAAGDKAILEVLVYADADTPVAPCGGCRQKLAEFAGPDVKVSLAGPEGIRAVMTVAELLPSSFSLK